VLRVQTHSSNQNGAANVNTASRKRTWHHWNSMLVRPVGTPDIQELEDKIDCWLAGVHDAAVVS
jgi:hypothetical protein